MRLSSRFALLLLLVLLAMLATSCRSDDATPQPAPVPTRPAVVTAVGPVGPPLPTPATLPPPAASVGSVAWTLTILHTGEVRGDVLPCG